MFTLAICLSFLSIFCLYVLSQKVEIEPRGIMQFLKTRKVLARALSGSALFLSTLFFIWKMGFAVGIFTSLLFWMCLACMIILFAPFGKVKWKHLTIGVAIVAGIEMGVLLF